MLLFIASTARADEIADQQVFMCLAAMGGATESSNERVAEDAYLGHFFWLGRINPDVSAERMTELARRASERLKPENTESALASCSEDMNRINDAFNEAVLKLQREGRAR